MNHTDAIKRLEMRVNALVMIMERLCWAIPPTQRLRDVQKTIKVLVDHPLTVDSETTHLTLGDGTQGGGGEGTR